MDFNWLYTVLTFIVVLTMIVIAHELGHFLTARLFKVKVIEFGLGLPPRMIKVFKDKLDTIYSLNWIPFGAFVRMFGEDFTDVKSLKDPNSLLSKKPWQKLIIMCSGVLMNFIVAYLMFFIVFVIGFRPLTILPNDMGFDSYIYPTEQFAIEQGMLDIKNINRGWEVSDIKEGSLADKKNIQVGDFVLKINDVDLINNPFSNLESVDFNNVVLLINRNNEIFEVEFENIDNQSLGINFENSIMLNTINFGFFESLQNAFLEIKNQSVLTVYLFVDMVRTLIVKQELVEGVAGPVGIVKMTGQIASLGIIYIIIFIGMLSVALGVLNILPFPALDGGRAIFVLLEMIFGKKLNPKIENYIHLIGFILLLILIFVVTMRDIGILV